MTRWFSGLSTLHTALLVSVAVHAALLAFRFAAPEQFNRVFQDTPLEVILVNARSEAAPEQAQAIAQASLQGGGEADQGRATSPLPSTLQMRDGDALEPDAEQVTALKQQQEQLLASLRAQIANLPPPQPSGETSNEAARAHEARRQALIQVLGEIERRINEQNARPKKRFISPATREAVYAAYYDTVRRKIEDHGTRNFPQAGGRKLYGELTMVMTINHDGRVLTTEVVQSSGNPTLDRRSEAIVQSLAFGAFDTAMRQRADQIVVVSRFRYARDETLRTQLSSQ
jgi:periplasmic protein TonB